MITRFDETALRLILKDAWSLDTARQWTPQTPAAGQCNVTTVAIFDLFGGLICQTPLEGYEVPHFYNIIDGRRVDLTDSQFNAPVDYADHPSDRKTAMRWVTRDELSILLDRLKAALDQKDV